jgi:phosphatidylserine decarboxylase
MGQSRRHSHRALNLFSSLQKILPKHAISRIAGVIAKTRSPVVAQSLIRAFARHYRVDLRDALEPSLAGYNSFNEFFTRPLVAGARPIANDPKAVVSPADGYLSQFGKITNGRLLQAKGCDFSLEKLLYDTDLASSYDNGSFLNVYLSPRDYHRVHAPTNSRICRTIEIPGKLFSVNNATANAIPKIFCRNERLVCVFEDYVMVMVGALLVASIQTTWDGPRSPYQVIRERLVSEQFNRGEEIARFLIGSTVIVLFSEDVLALNSQLETGMPIRMGQTVGLRSV